MTSVTASTQPAAAQPPTFGKVSRDHYRAAQLAAADGELRASADHLAGLAAECAIKAILLDFLGSRLRRSGKPYHPQVALPDPTRRESKWSNDHGHLPELWEHLTAIVHRRKDAAAGILFTALIWKNPFDDWDVANRYSDGATISRHDLDRHLKAAYDLIAAHEQAHILGTRTLA